MLWRECFDNIVTNDRNLEIVNYIDNDNYLLFQYYNKVVMANHDIIQCN